MERRGANSGRNNFAYYYNFLWDNGFFWEVTAVETVYPFTAISILWRKVPDWAKGRAENS